MRSLRLLSIATILAGVTALAYCQTAQPGAASQTNGAATAVAPAPKLLTMILPAFADGSDIPAKFTQAGSEASPAINWTNVPAGTVSFLLHMHDLDSTYNRGSDDRPHWVVWNIPGTSNGLPEGIPTGAKMENGAYQISVRGPVYRGPGPPANGPRHHFLFELFAIDTKIDVQPGTDPYETRASVMKAMQGHILGKAVYLGLFRRPQ